MPESDVGNFELVSQSVLGILDTISVGLPSALDIRRLKNSSDVEIVNIFCNLWMFFFHFGRSPDFED